MAGRSLANKWVKTAVLLSDPTVAQHIPQTRRYHAANLRSMLSQFGMVVIKPVVGGGGYGVIKVTKEGETYAYTAMSRHRSFSSFNGMFHALNAVKKKRQYIIQQGIHLAKIDGRPIDYRVKVVKIGSKYWELRSMVGRLARRGLFVTNLCKGGTRLTAAQGIRRSFSSRMVKAKKDEMRHLTVLSTTKLERRFPGLGELGFDYGIDVQGKIWIFEVNTRPQ